MFWRLGNSRFYIELRASEARLDTTGLYLDAANNEPEWRQLELTRLLIVVGMTIETN